MCDHIPKYIWLALLNVDISEFFTLISQFWISLKSSLLNRLLVWSAQLWALSCIVFFFFPLQKAQDKDQA